MNPSPHKYLILLTLLGTGVPTMVHAKNNLETPPTSNELGLTLAYVAAPDRPQTLVAERVAATNGPTLLFLNRCQGDCTIHRTDFDDSRRNSSLVPDRPTSTVAAWNRSEEDWKATVSCVRDMFAPFDIKIVDVDPGDAPHHESIVAGTPTDVFDLRATPEAVTYGGIAPLGCGGGIPNSMSYVFANHIADLDFICAAVAQEVGHTFGLDHLMRCDDPMTYLPACGPKVFQDVASHCGETGARECACTSASTQNSYQHIAGLFGTNDVPSVSITSYDDGAILNPGDVIMVDAFDDQNIVRVDLVINGEVVATTDRLPYQFAIPDGLDNGTTNIEVHAYDERSIAGVDSIKVQVEGSTPGELDYPNTGGDVYGGCSSSGSSSSTGWFMALLLGFFVSRKRPAAE